MRNRPTPTSHEVKLGEEELIISKTDISGRLTYTNRTFMEISGYYEQELLGVQHNIIRHPDMPRGVFRMLWSTLKAKSEFLGFVKNLCKDGSYYWVFASVTPDVDRGGNVVGYYSVRRQPPSTAIRTIESIYQKMLNVEQSAPSKKVAPDQSIDFLNDLLRSKGTDYERFVLELYG